MEDKDLNCYKRKQLRFRWIGIGILAVLISLLFLQINISFYANTEDESMNIRPEDVSSEENPHLFTEKERMLLTDLEKIEADLKIHH